MYPEPDPQADLQADADVDSTYAESEITDTESLRSWILAYRIENNRTYHVVSPPIHSNALTISKADKFCALRHPEDKLIQFRDRARRRCGVR